MIHLRGMTWRHDRGLAPMLATAQQFDLQRSQRLKVIMKAEIKRKNCHPEWSSARCLRRTQSKDLHLLFSFVILSERSESKDLHFSAALTGAPA